MKLPEDIREFFRKQGSIGGKKRKANLSAEKRTELARQAANARWANRNEEKGDSSKAKRRESK